LERGHQIIKSTGDSYFIVGWYAQFGISDDITILKVDGSGTPLWTRANSHFIVDKHLNNSLKINSLTV